MDPLDELIAFVTDVRYRSALGSCEFHTECRRDRRPSVLQILKADRQLAVRVGMEGLS